MSAIFLKPVFKKCARPQHPSPPPPAPPPSPPKAPPAPGPDELKNALLLKAMSGVLIYRREPMTRQKNSHTVHPACKLGSDLLTPLPPPPPCPPLPAPPLSVRCNKTCLTLQHNGPVVRPLLKIQRTPACGTGAELTVLRWRATGQRRGFKDGGRGGAVGGERWSGGVGGKNASPLFKLWIQNECMLFFFWSFYFFRCQSALLKVA